jgi:hypothetical protein
LTKLPIGKNLITSKWVFKVKKIASGKVDKLEARLVARGFQQYRGLDFDETFTPIYQVANNSDSGGDNIQESMGN